MSCIVRGCRSHSGYKENSGENISFHKFPKTEKIRRQWFAVTSRSEKQHKHHWRVCSRHFHPDCFVGGNLMRARLKENAVPTLNLSSITDVALDRAILDKSREQQQSTSELATDDMTCPSNSQHQSIGGSVVTKKSVGKPQYFSAMIHRISKRLLQTNVLEELHEHSLDNSVFDDHRNLLLKSVSETYLKIRIHHMTKQITAPIEKIRSFLTKTIIFRRQ